MESKLPSRFETSLLCGDLNIAHTENDIGILEPIEEHLGF